MPLPISELQKLHQHDPLIEIIGIDAAKLGGSFWYVTGNPPLPGTSQIVFNGHNVLSIPVMTGGWDESVDQLLPKPTITVSNITGEFFTAVQTLGDLVGATVYRWLIFASNLDNGSAPDPGKASMPDVYLIGRMTRLDDKQISWECMVPFELPTLKLPRRRVLRDKGFPGAGKFHV
jgi:lambda family phage minor tail protein L